METAEEPEEERVLRDGSRILLREVRPSDKGAIAAGFERLSPESRYRRFFTAMNRLSDSDLRYLTEVDHREHEAVLAFSREGEPVGVARYVRIDGPSQAEVAVAVVDEWQNRGAGTALLERLVERARENGIERFVATVLQENDEALELFRSVSPGDPKPRRTGHGQVELLIELPRDGISGTLLGRALRSAASGRVEIQSWRLIKQRIAAIAELRTQRGDGADGENRPER